MHDVVLRLKLFNLLLEITAVFLNIPVCDFVPHSVLPVIQQLLVLLLRQLSELGDFNLALTELASYNVDLIKKPVDVIALISVASFPLILQFTDFDDC